MNESETKKAKVNLLPQSNKGKFAFGLGVATLVLLIVTLINSGWAKPMSENILGFIVFLALLTALVALIVGLIAIIKDKERSILVFVMSAVGLAALVLLIVGIITDLAK